MGRQSFTISDFYCIRCGEKGMPLPRKKAKQKERGHMKKMFCIHCKCEVNHVEVKPYSDYDYSTFMAEFNSGKFANIPLPLK